MEAVVRGTVAALGRQFTFTEQATGQQKAMREIYLSANGRFNDKVVVPDDGTVPEPGEYVYYDAQVSLRSWVGKDDTRRYDLSVWCSARLEVPAPAALQAV